MEIIISPPPAAREDLPTRMVTPLLPPSVSSVMSVATASATRTRAVAAKFGDSGAWHFPLPSPSLSPSLLLPPQKSLACRMVVVLMPPPLFLSTLPPHLNTHRGSVASCPRAPLFPLTSNLPAGCCITCCHVPPPCFTFCCASASRIHP